MGGVCLQVDKNPVLLAPGTRKEPAQDEATSCPDADGCKSQVQGNHRTTSQSSANMSVWLASQPITSEPSAAFMSMCPQT